MSLSKQRVKHSRGALIGEIWMHLREENCCTSMFDEQIMKIAAELKFQFQTAGLRI